MSKEEMIVELFKTYGFKGGIVADFTAASTLLSTELCYEIFTMFMSEAGQEVINDM